MGERSVAYRVFGETEEKRPFVRPRRIWEDNIKMELKEFGWGAWTGLIWLKIRTGSKLV
jgi:hypothetical protein